MANHPTKSPARIDYQGFPHIVETILLYSDHKTLVAFRATCRTLRDAADVYTNKRLYVSMKAPLRLHLHRWRKRQNALATPHLYDPPWRLVNHQPSLVAPSRDDAQAPWLLSKIGRDLSDVEVLDVKQDEKWWRGLSFETAVLCEWLWLRSLYLVRVHHLIADCGYPAPYRPTTNVHTVHFIPRPLGTDRPMRKTAFAFGHGANFINFRYKPSSYRTGEDEIVASHNSEPDMGRLDVIGESKTQFVYFFFTTSPDDFASTPAAEDDLARAWHDDLFTLVYWLRHVWPGSTKFVFVGDPDHTKPSRSPRSKITSRERQLIISRIVLGMVGERLNFWQDRPPKWENALRELDERVTDGIDTNVLFMTFDELRMTLGEEMYGLVMEP